MNGHGIKLCLCVFVCGVGMGEPPFPQNPKSWRAFATQFDIFLQYVLSEGLELLQDFGGFDHIYFPESHQHGYILYFDNFNASNFNLCQTAVEIEFQGQRAMSLHVNHWSCLWIM